MGNIDEPIPENQQSLLKEIGEASTVLQSLFPQGDNRFDRYNRRLLLLAQLGLAGPQAQPDLAYDNLRLLRQDIVAHEGGSVKNRYMKTLGTRALAIGIVSTILALVFRYGFSGQMILSNFCFLWTACMAGVWLSFGARKLTLEFESLHIPEKDRLEPFIRLVFAGLLTLLVGLLFSTGVVSVQLGDINTTELNDNVRLALLIGGLCGFSEQVLSSSVAQQASRVLNFSAD